MKCRKEAVFSPFSHDSFLEGDGQYRIWYNRINAAVDQILDETDWISHSTNTLGEGMNPIILSPAMGKMVGQTRFFSLGEPTSLAEGKLWIQTC